MKQFNRTTQLALLGGALFGAALLPSAATAKPFPKKGYILEGQGGANIGRRASTLDAERASLRMMARLMKWFPNEKQYDLRWQTLDSKGETQLGWAYFGYEEPQAPPAPGEEVRKLSPILNTTNNRVYSPISRRIIYKVANYNGSFLDLTRYGNTTGPDDISIDLGVQKSYDAGSRATLRVLSKRLKSPLNSGYSIRWSYPSINTNREEVSVIYDPSTGNRSLYVEDSASIREIFHGVSQYSIRQAALHQGTFRNMVEFGAEDYFRKSSIEEVK